MKLLSIANSRSTWLFPFPDLNPKGKSLVSMLQPLVERYKFPSEKPEELIKGDHLEFKEGGYKTGSGDEIAIISFKVFNDGLVVDTRASTADADAFLHDVLTWGSESFGFVSYSEISIRKFYVSEVNVFLDHPLSLIKPALTEFADSLADHNIGYGPFSFEVSGIAFGQDPEKVHGGATTFRLERVDTAPFSETRFYSVAPFPTETHLALIEQLEKALTS